MKSSYSRNFSMAAVILLLALTTLGASFQFQVKDFLTNSTISNLQEDADVVSNLAESYCVGGNLHSREFLLNLDVISRVTDTNIVLCDQDGYVILCSNAQSGCEHQGLQLNREYLQQIIDQGGDTVTGVIQGLYTDKRNAVFQPIQIDGQTAGIVIISSPTNTITQVLNRISNIFLTAAFFVIALAVMAVSVFARRESKPLQDMAKAATAFGHGNLDSRVKLEEDYSEEMEELALAFNNMASSLQKSETKRQEFVANVSHELKTPMTTISGYIDGILDGTIPPERQEHYLRIVSDETKRLSRLVRSMLDVSRLQQEGGIPEEKKMHFDLTESVGQVLVTFEKKINDKGLNVDVDMPDHPVCTIANRDYITQVIYNLIDNAVKFCPTGGNLGIRIREGGSKAYISVSNDGETIPADQLPLVFDRFHKVDKSRSQNRDSWGLGLYIVKTIVCSHGENISVSSKDGKTEFTFTMPLVS